MHSTLSQTSLVQRTESFTQSLPGKATLAVAATVFVAVCAHISFPLPFTPVPLTLQTFAVILVGMALGPVVGGWIYDTFGRYAPMYIGSAVIGLGAVAIALAFPPFPRQSLKLKEVAT